MRVYLGTIFNNEYTLTEHLQAKWVAMNELMQLDWAPVDIPIAEKLCLSMDANLT